MDYKNGKIYALRSHQTDKYYIGSTTQPLYKRLYGHKHSNRTSSKELVNNYSDVYIELIEAFPCENKEQLSKRENELIREFKDSLVNILGVKNCIVSRQHIKKDGEISTCEYDQTVYNQRYYKKNKVVLNGKITCECGLVYSQTNKTNHESGRIHKLWAKMTAVKPLEEAQLPEPTEEIPMVLQPSPVLVVLNGMV